MFTNVLVPVDFSPPSAAAVRLAARLTAGQGRITLLHVGLSPELYYGDLSAYGFVLPETAADVRAELEVQHRQALQRMAAAEAPGADVRLMMREGYAPEQILAEAKKGYDLLVMGTHGRTGLGRTLLGSVTERVLRAAPIPVLTTHPTE